MYEYLAHLRVHNQLHITLTVTLFGVGKGIECLPVLFLDHRQGPQGLAQHRERLHMNADLAHLGHENETAHTHNVPYISQLLENRVVQRFVFARANLVTLYVQLDSPCGILQLGKRGRAHHPAAHDTPGNAYVLEQGIVLRKLSGNLLGGHVHFESGSRIRVDAHGFEFFFRLAAENLLVCQFHCQYGF